MAFEVDVTVHLFRESPTVILADREELLGREDLVEQFPASVLHSRESPILRDPRGKVEEASVISPIRLIEPPRADLASGGAVED